MGVTLERVQNKFACIIGELCSEPDILSEFAIWLDLRLAEYKAKGAIQLECSGETPDPTWLRGHKKPPKRLKSDPIQRLHHYDPASQYTEDVPQDVSERLSPEIVEVVVKEEVQEGNDVFPVSIHRHDISSSNRNHSRKRSSADGSSMGHSSENSSFKMQRLSPSTSTLEPVNESLMSIISENTADDTADMTANLSPDFSNLDSSNIDNSSYMIPSSNPVASTSGGDSADQQAGSNSAMQQQWMYAAISRPFGQTSKFPQNLLTSSRPAIDEEWYKQLYPVNFPERLTNENIQLRIPDKQNKTPVTVNQIMKAVATCERWIWVVFNEERNIENIAPSELDKYLAEYYKALRPPDGSHYSPSTFKAQRSYVERFLKENNYPVSITRSLEFSYSITEYAAKRRFLTEKHEHLLSGNIRQ